MTKRGWLMPALARRTTIVRTLTQSKLHFNKRSHPQPNLVNRPSSQAANNFYKVSLHQHPTNKIHCTDSTVIQAKECLPSRHFSWDRVTNNGSRPTLLVSQLLSIDARKIKHPTWGFIEAIWLDFRWRRAAFIAQIACSAGVIFEQDARLTKFWMQPSWIVTGSGGLGRCEGCSINTLSLFILRYAHADYWPSLAWFPLQIRPQSQHKHEKRTSPIPSHRDLALVQNNAYMWRNSVT